MKVHLESKRFNVVTLLLDTVSACGIFKPNRATRDLDSVNCKNCLGSADFAILKKRRET